jgi:hypothetical protein
MVFRDPEATFPKIVGGGGEGFGGGLAQGEGTLEYWTLGWDIPHQEGGKRSCWSGPKKEGGPY